jgi:hypothetical protein
MLKCICIGAPPAPRAPASRRKENRNESEPEITLTQVPAPADSGADGADDDMYVVLSYINRDYMNPNHRYREYPSHGFQFAKKCEENLVEVVNKLHKLDGVRVAVVECIYSDEGDSYEERIALGPIPGVWRHLRYVTRCDDVARINKINIANGVKCLPPSWEYSFGVESEYEPVGSWVCFYIPNEKSADRTVEWLGQKHNALVSLKTCTLPTLDEKRKLFQLCGGGENSPGAANHIWNLTTGAAPEPA